MKLPSRLAISSTTAITGLMLLSTEAHMSHVLHKLCLIGGAFILGLVVHPGESGTLAAAGELPPPVPASVTQDQPL